MAVLSRGGWQKMGNIILFCQSAAEEYMVSAICMSVDRTRMEEGYIGISSSEENSKKLESQLV